jgi:hypothetical protein
MTIANTWATIVVGGIARKYSLLVEDMALVLVYPLVKPNVALASNFFCQRLCFLTLSPGCPEWNTHLPSSMAAQAINILNLALP